jgi:hypothetical protein
MRDGGPPAIKPFINALQDFYLEISGKQSNGSIKVLNSGRLRRELFKLSYLKNEFVLNEKADAFEALDDILSLVHSWLAT